MPRIQFSDVTPPNNRRSIRDIPIPNGGKRKMPVIIKPEKKPSPDVESVQRDENGNVYEYYYPKNKNGEEKRNYFGRFKNKQWIFGTIIAVLIVVFIVSMMTVFASATVTIVPKSQEISVNMNIMGKRGAEEGVVKYEVLKLSESKTTSVPAAGEEMAELKASGKIVIYNNFSTEPQRLIVRTRFESPEGLIYRIPESTVIPGKIVKNGVETPGSIEVTVFADEAGEKYNIKKTDFTIPGFKNDAVRYEKFYARSSTDMTGGFVGKRKTVLPVDKETALQNIDSEAQADLKKELESKVPEGLVLLSGSIIYKSNELPIKEEASSVVMGKEITAYAAILDAQNLSDAITNEHISKLPEWDNIKSVIRDFSSISVTGLPDDLEANDEISFQINGRAKALADIDINVIGQKLLGAPKKDVAKLIDEFAGISSITSTIRPIWKQSFPKDLFKIHVEIAADK